MVEGIRRCRPLLGTFVEISTPSGAGAAIDAAYAAMAHVHARMSFHEAGSDLAALRLAPAGHPVAVDPETVAVLRVAAMLYDLSGGLFDVAIGARLVAAGFLPRPAGTDLRRMTGNAGDIEIIDDHHVRCHRPMLIDLGGIAKGHAVDRAIEMLAVHGIERAVVNAGGDLRVLGPRPEPVHLRGADGEIEGIVQIAGAALASSGSRAGRRRYRGRHVTPHLGRARQPVVAGDAVSIVAGTCIVADGMTKIALADPVLADRMLDGLGGAIVDRRRPRRAA